MLPSMNHPSMTFGSSRTTCWSISTTSSNAPSSFEISRALVILLNNPTLSLGSASPLRRDQLIASRSHGAQIAPAEVVQRVERLGVALEPEFLHRTGHQWRDGCPIHPRRRLDVQQIENRRHQIDAADYVQDSTAAGQPRIGRTNDQRDVRDAFVDEEPVRGFAVIVETLAVIADDDD